jgi:hypothetical protein
MSDINVLTAERFEAMVRTFHEQFGSPIRDEEDYNKVLVLASVGWELLRRIEREKPLGGRELQRGDILWFPEWGKVKVYPSPVADNDRSILFDKPSFNLLPIKESWKPAPDGR